MHVTCFTDNSFIWILLLKFKPIFYSPHSQFLLLLPLNRNFYFLCPCSSIFIFNRLYYKNCKYINSSHTKIKQKQSLHTSMMHTTRNDLWNGRSGQMTLAWYSISKINFHGAFFRKFICLFILMTQKNIADAEREDIFRYFQGV